MIYYRSKVRTEASVFCDSQVDKRCHFSVREVCHLNCDTSVRRGTVKRIQITAGPEVSVNSSMCTPIFFFFLVPCEFRYNDGGKEEAGRRDNRGM